MLDWKNISYPAALPITSRREDIIAAILAHPVVVIAGETGSGKTTQIPKMCFSAGFGQKGKIGCTQPRRVAALSVSRRVAEELGVTWGKEVGCKIRFADQTGRDTRIKFMTDGMLLAEVQGDPDLRGYEVIILDEAHERSLNIDFLLGHLKQLLERRLDLKLIITSATIDTKAFSEAFNNAPIIEVSGRVFPVEVLYAPLDAGLVEEGEVSYVDAAVQAVELAWGDPIGGDMLIFMPSERDIRETCDLLDGRFGALCDVVPLFGRLSSSDQQRVFTTSHRRKIVVATNVAETSLTIPGIRYVIDSGLARISRYNPRTRTKRLPIEPVSQSSANQRKGRSGRVQNGVCIRLYSEADFNERPLFTQPEIQRANLAEVILRMKTFRLGDIETFPFINPPTPAAIRAGYQLLQELGALDDQRQITALGEDLGRLPIDPTIGRMILQARVEHALPEMTIIAAGLSIQDPRERPMDAQEAANQAHKQFFDTESDFLTLLNVWDQFHDRWESLKTQNQIRKFCRQNFLSYLRMREWIDLHAQIRETIKSLGLDEPAPALVKPQSVPSISDQDRQYAAIHRSILSGLLGQVAYREEKNFYRAAGNRQVMLFPGSAVFDRAEAKKKSTGRERSDDHAPRAEKVYQPSWVVAGEVVETSRLFLRTVAGVEPEWVAELGVHLCKSTYVDPHWDEKSGRVLVREKVFLFGMELLARWVSFAKINSEAATEIFIREALVEDTIQSPLPFLEHNRALIQRLENFQTRLRHFDLAHLDQRIYHFYDSRLRDVSSVHDLNRVVREESVRDTRFLFMHEGDITGGKELAVNLNAFPDHVDLSGLKLAVSYAYAPGEEHDGVTVRLTTPLIHSLPPGALEWAIPGLRSGQIEELLRGLPKALRVPLLPIDPKVRTICDDLKLESDGFLPSLSRFIKQRYRVDIPVAAWSWHEIPPHLKLRVEVVGKTEKPVATGRNLSALREQLTQIVIPVEEQAWRRAVRDWEKSGITTWSFGDLPAQIELPSAGSLPILAYPGLEQEESHVNLRLYRTPVEAERVTPQGVMRLAELFLAKELAWLQKDLRALDRIKPLYVTLGSGDELTTSAYRHLLQCLLKGGALAGLRAADFSAMVEQARLSISGVVPRFLDSVGAILHQRQELLLLRKPYTDLALDLKNLLPSKFLEVIPNAQLAHLPRYLKAMQTRAERAVLNPAKDAERARLFQPYSLALQAWQGEKKLTPQQARLRDQFRWMLEEFRVSTFAQELGTAQPVSAKRLTQFLADAGRPPLK